MRIHRQRVRLASCLLLFVLSASAAFSQDKVRLKDAPATVGDAATHESTFEMSVNLVGKVDGQELPPIPLSNRERKAYQETILGVGASKVNGFRRTYSVHRQAEVTPDGNKETVSTLQGKTVTVKKVGSKTVVTVAKGKIDAAARQELTGEMQDNEMPDFLPAHPVAPGDEWTVDATKLKKSFGLKEGPTEASVKARFEEVVPRGGQRCARIHVVLKMGGTIKDAPLKLGLEVEGDIYHSLTLNHMLEMNLRGPVTMEGTVNEGGKEILLSGTGSARMKMVSRYLKIAGKPVK